MKLIKINNAEKRTSWDIEVENSHNFFANGTLVHNSNSAVALYKDTNMHDDDFYVFQSRERELSLQHDNAGFMAFMLNKNYRKLFEGIEFKESCVIYGEFVGKGVQSKVAISQLSKRFIIFAIRIDDVYQDMENFKDLKLEEDDIYNIMQFETYSIDIDFNQPELSQNKIVDITLAIEKECPVGKYFFNETMTDNVAYEENGKIWFLKENGFTDKLKPLLVDKFKEIRNQNKYGVNFIKFTLSYI